MTPEDRDALHRSAPWNHIRDDGVTYFGTEDDSLRLLSHLAGSPIVWPKLLGPVCPEHSVRHLARIDVNEYRCQESGKSYRLKVDAKEGLIMEPTE